MRQKPPLLRDTNIVAAISAIALILAIGSFVITLPSPAGPLNWYLSGLTGGLALASVAVVIFMFHRLRLSRVQDTTAEQAISRTLGQITSELRRRGDQFEAVLTPSGPTIRRRSHERPRLH